MATDPSSVIRDFITSIWNAGDTTAVRSYIHPEYSVDGEIVGPDWVATNVARFRYAFPDLTMTIEQIVAAGDLVAIRLRMQGTHLGQWKGIAPTHHQVDYQEAAFWTVDLETGLVRSGHFVADALTLRIQLGLLPSSIWQNPGTS